MHWNGRLQIDYTNKDYDSLRQALLELAREKLPAWTDQSPNDLGVVLLELFAYLADIQLYYQDRISNESYLETAVERRSIVNLLRLIGYELRPPQPASADLTLLFDDKLIEDNEDNSKHLFNITTGTVFQTNAKATGTAVQFQYIHESLTIDLNTLAIIKHTDGKSYKLFEPLPVTQVDLGVFEEVIGSSDGSPNQRFALSQKPLIDGLLVVSVDEGAGPRAWELQQTLLYSRAIGLDYVVRRDENDTAWVEFGDNQYGKVPWRGHNNITATYLVGGGHKGNVPPNTINQAIMASNGNQLKLVFNRQAASGGADAETSSEAARRGPLQFRAMGRAVTAQDYASQAMAFGVGKARAQATSWNRVDLFVAPAGGGYPSHTLKEDLRHYFEDKRLMTSIVEIHDPVYVNVYVEGTLDVEAYYFTRQVQQRVEKAIKELLTFDKVDFGEDRLYLSKVYEAIEKIEGVAGIDIDRFARSDSVELLPETGKLHFNWNEIPWAGHASGILLTEVRGGRRAE